MKIPLFSSAKYALRTFTYLIVTFILAFLTSKWVCPEMTVIYVHTFQYVGVSIKVGVRSWTIGDVYVAFAVFKNKEVRFVSSTSDAEIKRRSFRWPVQTHQAYFDFDWLDGSVVDLETLEGQDEMIAREGSVFFLCKKDRVVLSNRVGAGGVSLAEVILKVVEQER